MSETKRQLAGLLAVWFLLFSAALPGLHTCRPEAGGAEGSTARLLPDPGRHAGHFHGECVACHFGSQGLTRPPPARSLSADFRPVRTPAKRVPRPRTGRAHVFVLPRGPPPSIDV